MHCNVAEQVVYAGEFHFRFSEKGNGKRRKLVIDNASGTYAPGKSELPKLQKVLELNFPGLEVEAVDFRSDQLRRCKEEMEEKGIV